MRLWLAVPEDDDGMWLYGDPIVAETEAKVRKLATEEWSGDLSPGVEVVIYSCHQEGVLDLPKDEEPEEPAEQRCPDTLDMFASL
jgi:hypothetical protein